MFTRKRISASILAFLFFLLLFFTAGCASKEDTPPTQPVSESAQQEQFPAEESAPPATPTPEQAPVPEPEVKPAPEMQPKPEHEAETVPEAAPDPEPAPDPDPEPAPLPEPEPTGLDYVLNTNSMKFHYPSCGSAAKIKSSNRADFHGTREELINKGYSPCGNCEP